MLAELERELGTLETQVADLETRSLLSGEHDRLGALVIIHPGAGGTESQDWAEMLMRMYQRWAERQGYDVKLLDYQAGDEAGIKDATLEIDNEYAYGISRARRRAPPGAHLALRRERAPAHVVLVGERAADDRQHHQGRDRARRPAHRHHARGRRGGSTSTRPSRRCASPTCRPGSWCSRRPSAASTATRTRR
jgi:hypothetical protein